MDLLNDKIDNDTVIISLDDKSTYTDMLLLLLKDPNPDLLSKLVINCLNKMIVDLKHLIKIKYAKLKMEIHKNIQKIVLLLLGYGINVDTLIINLLRHGYKNFPLEHKYFKEYKGALAFIKFHLKERCTLPLSSVAPTLITYDMETDILFISTVDKNSKFYIGAFIHKYASKAEEILLYVSGKNLGGFNIDYLVNCLKKLVDPNKEYKIHSNTYDLDQMNNIKHEEIDQTKKFVIKEAYQVTDAQSILLSISELSFPEYFTLINNMKSTKRPFIDSKFYKDIIFASFGYDNYVQVYLWKILVYQKILFEIEIEVEESDLKTEEALEGYDIYLNIH